MYEPKYVEAFSALSSADLVLIEIALLNLPVTYHTERMNNMLSALRYVEEGR